MEFKCFAKRVIPFAVALGIGLFIASFFVTLSTAKTEVEFDSISDTHHKLRIENRRLKRENCRLKMESKIRERFVVIEGDLDVPPPPPPPAAPLAPVAPKVSVAPKAPAN